MRRVRNRDDVGETHDAVADERIARHWQRLDLLDHGAHRVHGVDALLGRRGMGWQTLGDEDQFGAEASGTHDIQLGGLPDNDEIGAVPLHHDAQCRPFD